MVGCSSVSRGEATKRLLQVEGVNENPKLLRRWNHHYSYGGASRPLFHYTPGQPRPANNTPIQRPIFFSSGWLLAAALAATGVTIAWAWPSEEQHQQDKNHRDSIRQAMIDHARQNIQHNPAKRPGPLKRRSSNKDTAQDTEEPRQ